jgi:hypothetical protein
VRRLAAGRGHDALVRVAALYDIHATLPAREEVLDRVLPPASI